MAEKMSRTEHPLPAVVMHWLHLTSFFVLIATGLLIHTPRPSLATMQTVDTIHFVAMFVFVLTTVVRIYWAFLGAGSATLASVKRVRDYKHFAMTRLDWKTIGGWLTYYLFLRKEHPYTPKYNPLQKLTYGYFFPLGILLMALTGFAMFAPTASAMTWFTANLGGQNGVRLIHYLGMWILISVFLIHFYLVLFEDLKELPNMLARHVPRKYRVAGDYSTVSSAPHDHQVPVRESGPS